MIKVELFECLDAVERDAAGALDRERQACLFDRLSWYRLLERHCPPPGKLLVARAEDASGGRSWQFLSVQQRRAQAYANWYSFQAEEITSGRSNAGRSAAIARALRAAGLVSLERQPLRDIADAKASYAGSGWSVFADETSATWFADVQGLSFDAYWNKRPAKLRHTAERKAKSALLSTSIYSDFTVGAWSDYESVYRESWKPEEGSPAFLRALAEQEGAAGTLRLGIARIKDQAVAAQFWLVENGRATIHKLAYCEGARRHSPGTLLSMAMFRHVIDDDRADMIDFGLGDEPYKADWMNRREPVGRVVAYNRATSLGLAGSARETAAALVRRLRNN